MSEQRIAERSEGRWIVGKRRWIRRYWVHEDARRAPDVLMGAGVKIMASVDKGRWRRKGSLAGQQGAGRSEGRRVVGKRRWKRRRKESARYFEGR